MSAKFALGLTLLLAPFAVLSKQPYVDIEQRLTAEQLHATGLDQLSPEQLKLLNGLLREDVVKAVEASKAETETERATSSLIGLNDQPIRSRLKGSVSGWEPGTVFELENGQTWKVLKGNMKLRKPFESPEIAVIPGIAGRWFLQVDEDLPKARVYRID
ncbi:MAG TPA: hypothetical protein VF471_03125 [Pseudoxanthomonas sp.]